MFFRGNRRFPLVFNEQTSDEIGQRRVSAGLQISMQTRLPVIVEGLWTEKELKREGLRVWTEAKKLRNCVKRKIFG